MRVPCLAWLCHAVQARGHFLAAKLGAFGYRLADAQIELRRRAPEMLLVTENMVGNGAAARERNIGRASLTRSAADLPAGSASGHALRRFLRTAALAVFGPGDGRLHSAARDGVCRAACGFNEGQNLRWAGFCESGEGSARSALRLPVDLIARW